jgi:hypothetical protein
MAEQPPARHAAAGVTAQGVSLLCQRHVAMVNLSQGYAKVYFTISPFVKNIDSAVFQHTSRTQTPFTNSILSKDL